jgi:hypothetical protein
MACITGIVKNITSDCTTSLSGGLEVEAWIFNRAALTPTYDGTEGNLLTTLANVGAAVGYKLKGIKKLLNAGHDIVVAEDRPDKYTHFFSFQGFEIMTDDILNLDDMNDVVVALELKDKNDTGEGIFVLYGLKKGLWKTADTRRWNDINGARKIEMASLSGQEEPYSHYILLDNDYATTHALLESLLT